jgi:hypothetical protein
MKKESPMLATLCRNRPGADEPAADPHLSVILSRYGSPMPSFSVEKMALESDAFIMHIQAQRRDTMKTKVPEKIDFSVTHKDLYTAQRKVKEVTAGRAVFLSFSGQGEPGGPDFQKAIEQLYSVVYTVKFTLKFAGQLDFAISKLECLYHVDKPESTPMSEWRWQMLIRIPDAVKEGDLKKARTEINKKKQLDTSGVKRITWKEGRCVQVMHVGPYGAVGASYSQLGEYARDKSLTLGCPAHEIYISDPRRVAPEKLKTIVRLSVTSG